jgi:muconolactone delta-isomerase
MRKGIEAMACWQERHKDEFVPVWDNADTQGCNGIVDVNNLEELDVLMAEFPFRQFSGIEITLLVDLEEPVKRAHETLKAQTGGRHGRSHQLTERRDLDRSAEALEELVAAAVEIMATRSIAILTSG